MDPIAEDYLSYMGSSKSKVTRLNIFTLYVRNRGFRAIYVYRKRNGHLLSRRKGRWLFWEAINSIFIAKSVFIAAEAEIGGGLDLHHPYSITLGKCKIGRGCNINQNTTIGHNFKKGPDGRDYPILGDNVWLLPGAGVFGPITIGSNVMIAANSVVINDIPDNSVVAGAPAKVVAPYDWKRYPQYTSQISLRDRS
jgi:serine O-acetyltransferase